MGPIEVLYIIIGSVVVLIAVARGYVKELGATLIILVGIFILSFFEDEIVTVLTRGIEALVDNPSQERTDLILSTLFTLAFTAIVFAGYVGKTLEFPGRMAAQPAAFLISFLVGLINGYLIAGTLWYYQDAYGYPWFEGFISDFSDTAQRMIELLPPALFDNPVFWIVPVAILLLIRVRG